MVCCLSPNIWYGDDESGGGIGTDACALPVLSTVEAAALATKSTESSEDGVPVPHPQLSRTPSRAAASSDATNPMILEAGAHTNAILAELGIGRGEREAMSRNGAVGGATRNAKL